MLKNLFLLITLVFSAEVFACPNWQATIHNNQPNNWDYLLNPQNIAVVNDPLLAKSKVFKLTITPDSTWPNGHTRAEVKHNGCATNEGETTYLSWEFYIDKQITTLNNIAYWESDKTYQQSMGFSLEPAKVDDLPTTKLTFYSSLPERQVHWQNSVNIAKWNKLALAIKWSESQQKGQVSLWFNQRAIFIQKTLKTKPDLNKMFIQLGLHRNQSEATVDNIYLRNVRETSTLNKLLGYR
jgi:hypothetical protein